MKINGIKVYTLNFKNISKKKMMYSFIKNLKILNSVQFDLIYFFSVTPRDWKLFLLAKFYSKYRKIPIVYDYFISKFQTFYEDRELFSRKNKIFKAFKYIFLYSLDYFECLLSDNVILDTNTHIEYFNRKFKLKKKKFTKILVGAEPIFRISKIFDNNDRKLKKFKIGFWGTYIPLHGIEYVVKAANLLKEERNITFSLLGRGQTYDNTIELAKSLKLDNIEFLNMVPLQELPHFISGCDIGLGIFGKGEKSSCVIPNKVFEAIQMKVPIITSNTPAIKELFTHMENIYLCQKSNHHSLANAILDLVNNQNLRKKISENAFQLYREKTCLQCIAKDLEQFFLDL